MKLRCHHTFVYLKREKKKSIRIPQAADFISVQHTHTHTHTHTKHETHTPHMQSRHPQPHGMPVQYLAQRGPPTGSYQSQTDPLLRPLLPLRPGGAWLGGGMVPRHNLTDSPLCLAYTHPDTHPENCRYKHMHAHTHTQKYSHTQGHIHAHRQGQKSLT